MKSPSSCWTRRIIGSHYLPCWIELWRKAFSSRIIAGMRCGRPMWRMSSNSCGRSAGFLGEARAACVAIAHRAQIMPGINSAGVAIVPIEADRISSDRVDFVWSNRGFEDWQRCFWLRFLFPRSLPSACVLLRRLRMGTRPATRQMSSGWCGRLSMHVDPRAICLIDADMLRIDGFA